MLMVIVHEHCNYETSVIKYELYMKHTKVAFRMENGNGNGNAFLCKYMCVSKQVYFNTESTSRERERDTECA